MKSQDDAIRAALYELLQAHGYEAAADALYGAQGILTIPRSQAETRDGRDEIVAAVGEAFDEGKIGLIVITEPDKIKKAVEAARGGKAPTQIQAYA